MGNLRPNAPRNVTGEIDEDGSISLNWDAVKEAQSYVIHYGGANQSEPTQAVNMGYSETTNWNLVVDNVPALALGDKLYLYLQTYHQKGLGANDVEKARYLHDGDFVGSAWSAPVILTNPS